MLGGWTTSLSKGLLTKGWSGGVAKVLGTLVGGFAIIGKSTSG